MLALGGVDSSIWLLLRPPGGSFQRACRLKGHADWVRSLAFWAKPGMPSLLYFEHIASSMASAFVTYSSTHTYDGKVCCTAFDTSPECGVETADGGLLLASASQDRTLRIWAIRPADKQAASNGHAPANGHPPHEGCSGDCSISSLAKAIARCITCMQGPSLTGVQTVDASEELVIRHATGAVCFWGFRYAPQPSLAVAGGALSATLGAVLVGHEDWVCGAAGPPQQPGPGGAAAAAGHAEAPCLLSASMDRTMMLWRPDASTGESAVSRLHC